MLRKTSKICIWGGIVQKHHLNVKIIDTILDSEYEKPIKDFLIGALIVEFKKMDHARPRVKDDYKSLINKGAAEMRGHK